MSLIDFSSTKFNAKEEIQKKSKKKLQTKKSKVSLEESFNKLFQFRYLGLVIAVLYFVILLILKLSRHKSAS